VADVDYQPGSAFGWLDYDERDAQRMREALSAFDEKQTADRQRHQKARRRPEGKVRQDALG